MAKRTPTTGFMPEETKTSPPCAWPGCQLPGTFPAPRDPRNLAARQYFCKAHIAEFNKSWNGLSGMNTEEIYRMQTGAAHWHRPTWRMGSEVDRRAQATFKTADELYRFFRNRQRNEKTPLTFNPTAPDIRQLPPDVAQACQIFGLEYPTEKTALKRLYLKLVKQAHPDVNAQTPEAEERAKELNVAYRILLDFLEKNLLSPPAG